MTDERPRVEFGKRRRVTPLPPEPAPKRSGHVALLVMGTMAVGGAAFALMPGQTCVPPQPAAPGMAAPAVPPTGGCTSRGSSYSGGGTGSWSSFHFYGGDSASRASSAASSESSGGVTRGGFGSFARAFGFGGG